MSKRERDERACCPVCKDSFGTEAAMLAHKRDKRDARHIEHRQGFPTPTTAQKRSRPTGAFIEAEQARTEAADGHEAGVAADDGVHKGAGGAGSALKKGPDIMKRFTNVVGTVKSSINSLLVGAGNPSPGAPPPPPHPPSDKGRAGTEQAAPRTTRSQAQASETQLEKQDLGEELRQAQADLKQAKQNVAKYRDFLSFNNIDQSRMLDRRDLINKLWGHKDQIEGLRKNNGALLHENERLEDTMAQWRAARSEAEAGNDNINGNFPFKKEIVASYQKLVNEPALDLLDPCFEDDDMMWGCAVSKRIFEICQESLIKCILAPQRDFKQQARVGEGAQQESEWEPTRVFMTKLQRATRERVLSDLKKHVEKFADEVEAAQAMQEPDLTKLAQHKDYKKGSLENVMFKLMKVGRSLHVKSFTEFYWL